MQQDKSVVLALDSSSAPLLLALKAGGKTYTAKHGGIKQEEYLFTIIRRLYAKAGVKFNATTHFFFVKGPGRFTGIRIGITLASMLNSLLNTHAASADIFEILKYQAENSKEYKNWLKENKGGIIAVVVHAFREEYFACVYDGDNKPVWLSFEALQELLAKQQKPLFVTGWDKERLPLSGVLSKQYTYASAKISKVLPQTMLDFAQSERDNKDVLEPLYLKPARFELGQK
jgi:tRNA threonylcarbamoyl adenosine modification protein YeaZ